MAFLEFRRGRKQVSPGLSGLRLSRKRDKLGKHYYILEVFFGRLALVLGVLAFTAYFVGAFALYQWREIKMGEYNRISYADILLAPFDWKGLVTKQGESQIAKGLAAYKREDWNTAYMALLNGLSRKPEDQSARYHLAEIELRFGNHQKATLLLVEGLQYGYPQEQQYPSLLFGLMKYNQNLEALDQAARWLLKMPEIYEDPQRKYGIELNLLRSRLVSRKFLEAYEQAKRLNLDPELPYRVDDSVMFSLIRLGRADEALAYRETLDPEIANEPALLLMQADALRNLQRNEEAASVLKSIFRKYPHAASTHRQAILLMLLFMETDTVNAFIELYLNRHADKRGAIVALANNLCDLPDSRRVRYIYQYAVRRDIPDQFPLLFLVAQAYLTEGQWEKAQKHYALWKQQVSPQTMSDGVIAFERLLEAIKKPGQETEQALVDSLNNTNLDAELFWEAAEALRKTGNYPVAIEIGRMGAFRYPHNSILAEMLTTLESEQDLSESERLESMRKGSEAFRSEDLLPTMRETSAAN